METVLEGKITINYLQTRNPEIKFNNEVLTSKNVESYGRRGHRRLVSSDMDMNGEPIKVAVTGAAGQIAYSLLHHIGHGEVFGPFQEVILQLLDIPPMMGVLDGVVMEIMDCALPLVKDIIATSDPAVAFKDVDAAFLVGSMPRKEGMERKDLLSANVKIFKTQGEALDKYAKKTVKVLVVGNPANTNALICSKYAPSIPKDNFSAMTRLDHNRATAQLAHKLGVNVSKIKNVIIWGNHSSTQFPDATHASVIRQGGSEVSVVSALNNDKWLQEDFVNTIQKRGAAVIAARKMSSAMSAAKAARDHMRDIWQGTRPGEWVSMGVLSEGLYGAPKNVIFSFPVTIKNKQWTIVQGLSLNKLTESKIVITGNELLEEREEAMAVCEN